MTFLKFILNQTTVSLIKFIGKKYHHIHHVIKETMKTYFITDQDADDAHILS